MGKRKRKHKPPKSTAGAQRAMEEHGNEAPANKAKKRFWTGYDSTEKFNFFVGLFIVFSSIATGGLYVITKRTLVVSQQAYVFAKTANVISAPLGQQVPPANAPPQVDITFRNSGQTVARQFKGTINFYFAKDGIPADFLFPENNLSQPSLVGPQSETHLTKILESNVLAKVRSRELLFFVYGSFTYKDVFGNEHRSEYAFNTLAQK